MSALTNNNLTKEKGMAGPTILDYDTVNLDEDKQALETLNGELRSALAQNNPDDIRAKMETLTTKFNEVSTKLYQQAGAQAGADPNMGGAGFDPGAGAGFAGDAGAAGADSGSHPDDNVVDADYTVVDEDTPSEN